MSKSVAMGEAGPSTPAAKKKRRARPDRAAKLKARRELRETVVKSCLRGGVRGDARCKDAVVTALRRRVDAFSRRVGFASVALQGIVKEAFDGVDDVGAAVVPPELFEQTFVRQLLLGTDDAILPSPLVADYYARHPDLAPPADHPRFMSDSNVYSAGAIKLLTNLKNSLTTNVERRVWRFAKAIQTVRGWGDGDKKTLVRDVLGWPPTTAHGCCFPRRLDVVEAVSEQRRVLGLADGERVGKAWVRSPGNLAAMLRHAAALVRFEEANDLPTFSLTPICRVRRHFVIVDTSVFFGVARELGLVAGGLDAFEELADDHWRSVFNIDRLAGRNKTFTRTIETDGTAWCVHFTCPKLAAAAGPKGDVQLDTKRFRYVAIDPGRENIYFAAERDGDAVRTWRLTRKAYYRESGASVAIRRSNRWNENVADEIAALANASPRGVDVARHEAYIAAFVATFPSLWHEFSKTRWAEQRLRLYGGKKRVFARFFERIRRADPSRDVVVAYGSASYAPGGRFELSVPTTKAFKECAARFQTRAVDEYRTTAVHHEDDSILQRVAVRGRRTANWDARAKATVSRGLLWCGSTGNSKFVNRDKNAALNILRCLTNRPRALTRTPDKRKLERVVGKVIRR